MSSIDKIREYYVFRGMSIADIEKALKVSCHIIQRLVDKWGFTKERNEYREKELYRLFIVERKLCEEIAVFFGVTVSTIYNWCEKFSFERLQIRMVKPNVIMKCTKCGGKIEYSQYSSTTLLQPYICHKCRLAKPWLYRTKNTEKYIKKELHRLRGKSCREIALFFGMKDSNTIRNWLKKFDFWKPRVPTPQRIALNKWAKERRETDSVYRLICNLRSNLYTCLRDGKKGKRIFDLLGYTKKQYIDWLKQTTPIGYDYRDRDLVLDHIIPCSLSKTDEQAILLFQLPNLRLILRLENLIKHARFTKDHVELVRYNCIRLYGRKEGLKVALEFEKVAETSSRYHGLQLELKYLECLTVHP